MRGTGVPLSHLRRRRCKDIGKVETAPGPDVILAEFMWASGPRCIALLAKAMTARNGDSGRLADWSLGPHPEKCAQTQRAAATTIGMDIEVQQVAKLSALAELLPQTMDAYAFRRRSDISVVVMPLRLVEGYREMGYTLAFLQADLEDAFGTLWTGPSLPLGTMLLGSRGQVSWCGLAGPEWTYICIGGRQGTTEVLLLWGYVVGHELGPLMP